MASNTQECAKDFLREESKVGNEEQIRDLSLSYGNTKVSEIHGIFYLVSCGSFSRWTGLPGATCHMHIHVYMFLHKAPMHTILQWNYITICTKTKKKNH